jgi:hypothetical protein
MRALTPLVLALAIGVLDAQTFVTPRGEAQKVRVEQREDGIVHIFYDLISSDPRAVFAVRLEASQDAGATFGIQPESITGDTGDGIRPGAGKRIVWDSGKDVERVQIDRFRFRIIATGAPLAVEPPRASEPVPPANPAQPPTVAAPPIKKGSGVKWLLIGGGAAAAAGVGLAAGGGGSNNGSVVDSNTTPTATPPANRAPSITSVSMTPPGVLLNEATVATFEVIAADADGDQLNGSWAVGGETLLAPIVGGRGAVTKVFGFPNTVTVTVTDGRGGSASASYPAFSVAEICCLWTGRLGPPSCAPSSSGCYTFRVILTHFGQPGHIQGEYEDQFGRFSRFAGGRIEDPRALNFAVTLLPHPILGAGETISFRLTGSTDLRTFTGSAGSSPVTITR